MPEEVDQKQQAQAFHEGELTTIFDPSNSNWMEALSAWEKRVMDCLDPGDSLKPDFIVCSKEDYPKWLRIFESHGINVADTTKDPDGTT